jgi:hypothetical protein
MEFHSASGRPGNFLSHRIESRQLREMGAAPEPSTRLVARKVPAEPVRRAPVPATPARNPRLLQERSGDKKHHGAQARRGRRRVSELCHGNTIALELWSTEFSLNQMRDPWHFLELIPMDAVLGLV